ncbi:EAL domain-containing protein [Xanthomonadaceae bacterium XH05]|nr:EAL domain-containing protein [Xanthomonadaceae bacterium XH05]
MLLLAPITSQAVVRDYYFRMLDSRHGLSQSTVTAMLQDRTGFVWIATQGDLHRFDGHAFQPLDGLARHGRLPSFVRAMAEDDRGRIHLGTLQDGLFIFDPAQSRVEHAQAEPGLPDGRIDALLYQTGAGLWIGWRGGVGLFDPEGGHYHALQDLVFSPSQAADGGLSQSVQAMALDPDGILWVAATHGLYRIDTATRQAEQRSTGAVNALLVDGEGDLWMGTPTGLYRQQRGAAMAALAWPQHTSSGEAPCCEPIALAQAADGAIWMSVRDGTIWRYDPLIGEAQALPASPWVDGMLAEVGMPRMMIDRSNLLWLGGLARGVATTPASGTPFRAVFDMDPSRDPLTGNFIRAIFEGNDGELWLGTLAGLRRYEPLRDHFDTFENALPLPEGVSQTTRTPVVTAIGPVGDGKLWLATHVGLYRFDPQQPTSAEPIPLPGGPAHLRVMARVRDGSLWIGHGNYGLLRLDPTTGEGTPMPPRPDVDGAHQQEVVTAIIEDSRGRIWVGGTRGVSLFDPDSQTFRNFVHDPERSDSLSGNIVRAIHETRDGLIWIGSHHGLDQVIESTSGQISFRSWPFSGESADWVVYGIAEDNAGRLWLSGNNGIVRVDRGDGTQVRFGLTAGLQDLEFNGGAVAMLRDGQLAFGGIRGFNLVDPARVQPSRFDAPVALTWIGAGQRSPTALVTQFSTISIPQQHRVLSLGFAALDYTAPENNLFSWRLEGFDPEFSTPAPRSSVVYTNLAPGQYLFRARATNHAGMWGSNELRVTVNVLPPWWRSTWAYAVYALLLAGMAGLLWRLQRQRSAYRASLMAQIREREDRLKLSLWGAGDSFWDWDLRSNQIHRIGADHLLHVPADQQLSTEEWRHHAIHPDDLPRMQYLMQEHLEGRSEAYESEHRVRNARGEWIWVRARGKVVEYDADFNPLRVAGTARDITASRHADRERRIATEVLRSMNEAVAVIDLNLRFVSVNPAFSRITGYNEHDVIGMPTSLLESTQHPPEFYRRAHEELTVKGHYKGEVWLRRADGEEFLGWVEQNEVCDEGGMRTHFVSVVNDITDKKRAEQELRYLANYDTLTGLPNRGLLSERLARAVVRARRNETRVAVLFLDLDHFKVVNDSLGHAAGDRILKSSAARLLGVVGSSDTVARLGGDEFTIVMEDVGDPASVTAMAEAVIAAFGEPVLNEGHGDIVISPSIGISLFPEHAQVPTDLLKFADAAMYRAKERGRNTFQFYDESMDAEVRRRATMTAALRRALDRNELHLAFQPRQSLFDGRVTGVEALLRWNSEEFGEVQPGVFIPLAEETGLILPIGEWVLEQACRCLCRWREQGIENVGVAVNISVLQLLRGNIPASVARVLAATGLPPSCLELELTESMVMANAEQTITILRDLKRLGVSIAIDDFGTGYSSLIYLKRLPIDTLKIDKEFVGDLTRDPDDEAITATIISMAHSLGLTVIAEGVETPEQLRYLREHGCDEVQGFLLARPMQADDCLDFLRRHAEQWNDLPVG